jgi:hypothetical protein
MFEQNNMDKFWESERSWSAAYGEIAKKLIAYRYLVDMLKKDGLQEQISQMNQELLTPILGELHV